MKWLLLMCGWGATVLGAPGPTAASLPDRFANPPAEARILKIIHGWPENAKTQQDLIGRLERQGFGGVVCNVSFSHYLESETQWQAFTRAVNTARQTGMALWLYDERGYPSGAAGGLVLRDHQDWEAEGLLIGDLESSGGEVALDLPPGQPLLTAAFPVRDGRIDPRDRIDLSDQVRDGKLRWLAPARPWRVICITESRLFEGTHAELNLAAKIAYPNLLRPEPTARFLQLTHQRYAEHLGENLGAYFTATFTDEPSLMSYFLRPMPYRVLPWAPNLPVQFEKRRGYALNPVLPALVADAGSEGQRNRYDFWKTVGELVAENYFGQIQTWCRRHHLKSGGHLLMEEDLVSHVPLYGDFFACARRLDAPGIDCLTSLPSQVPWLIARLLSSAAELEGGKLVMSETSDHSQRYRPAGDKRPVQTVSEGEIRGTCNRLFVSGINRITSYYSFAGLDDAALRRLNEWVGRCASMLEGGYQVADVAVLYPIESLWPKFQPARHRANAAPAASRVEQYYRSAAESLFSARRDFTFIDGRALAEATLDSGTLVHGNLRWRVVVLPGVDTLTLAAWENLARFVAQGGVAIALGAWPANSETEFPSARVQALAGKMFGRLTEEPTVVANPGGGAGIFLPPGSESMLAAVIRRFLEPDVTISPARSPVRATRRRVDGHEIFFLINDSSKPWEGEAQFAASGNVERCDPATGRVDLIKPGDRIRLRFQPYGATLFRFAKSLPRERRRLSSGPLPGLVHRSVPAAVPILAKGEFVRGELKPDSRRALDDRPAWRATAVLTKGRTDTFLFARLPCPQPLDLSRAEALGFDTWVPEDQKTGNQLLVILHEKDGGDFLASTGRMLNAPGHERTCIPLTQFQLAGWSKDKDGELDARRVDEVRLGWGGYLGEEGERVEFTFAWPQMVELAERSEESSAVPRQDAGGVPQK
jgi:alpha-L-rhamnosidase